MKSAKPLAFFAAAIAAALSLAPAGAAWAAPPPGDLLFVNLVWHQHQPLYYKDPATGLYTRPWVRVHAT